MVFVNLSTTHCLKSYKDSTFRETVAYNSTHLFFKKSDFNYIALKKIFINYAILELLSHFIFFHNLLWYVPYLFYLMFY